MVKVFAHRGASGTHPENTAAAFNQALVLGVEAVEFDVRLSRDSRLVVIHDATVDRTSDGVGQVSDLALDEIGKLDAGGWFGDAYRGQRFLTVEEALGLLQGRARLNVHVKATDQDREAVISQTVAMLAERSLMGSAFLASDQESIVRARQLAPELDTCNLSTKPKETYIARSLSVGCRILQPGHQQVDAEFVSEAHRHGLEVNPFYADEESEMRRLIACGVDGILTNFPERLMGLRAAL
jgi:glycerophosphoryl diester phosphodiesterase